MFSTFTKQDSGALAVRSEDIRSFFDIAKDGDPQCIVVWYNGEERHSERIQGTTAENLQRIAKEELDAALQVDAMRAKQAQGYPVPPIVRGRR